MDASSFKFGYWSAIIIALLVALIDVGMVLSTILFPITAITSIEAYAASFSSWQMLPLIPSLILAPMFAVFIACIQHFAAPEKKMLGQLAFFVRDSVHSHPEPALLHSIDRCAARAPKQPNRGTLAAGNA